MIQYTPLLTIRMLVAELRVMPGEILRATQKLGIPVFEYAQLKLIQLTDLSRLRPELSSHQLKATDLLTVGAFANLMEVTCTTVNQWIEKNRIHATGDRGNRMIAWIEMQKISDAGFTQGYISLKLAAQILGITEQVLRTRMKRTEIDWRWYHRTRTIRIEDLNHLGEPEKNPSIEGKESATPDLCIHDVGGLGAPMNKGNPNVRNLTLATITRKAKTVRLLKMLDCVVALSASPMAIKDAAQKAGVPLLMGDETLFFRKIDLSTLAAELKGQPPSLPDRLSVNEFAITVGVSPSTVDMWIRERKIEAVRNRGVTCIAQCEIQKVIEQDIPKGYVDLKTAARMLPVSEQAVRARLCRRKIRQIRHTNKVLIAQRDVDRLARFDGNGPTLPDYVCIKEAAHRLGVAFAELRKAVAEKKVQATVVTDREGTASYQLSEQQLAHAREYFFPDAAPLNQIALHLGVSIATVKRMVSKGLLETIMSERQTLVTRLSYEQFVAHKAGLTPREAAERLDCQLREIDELTAVGSLRYMDPDLPILLDRATLEQYRAEYHPRSLNQAAEELGFRKSQVKLLINTQRLRVFKTNGQIRIPVSEVRAFQQTHLEVAVTIADAAQILGKEPGYIRTLLKTNKLKPYHLGSIQLVVRASVAEYQEHCQEKAALSYDQAAERLGCTVSEVKSLVRRRKLRVTPKKRLITAQAVEDYIANQANSQYYTVAETSKVLSIDTRKVYRLIEQRKLQATTNGTYYLVLRDSVDRYRAEQREKLG